MRRAFVFVLEVLSACAASVAPPPSPPCAIDAAAAYMATFTRTDGTCGELAPRRVTLGNPLGDAACTTLSTQVSCAAASVRVRCTRARDEIDATTTLDVVDGAIAGRVVVLGASGTASTCFATYDVTWTNLGR